MLLFVVYKVILVGSKSKLRNPDCVKQLDAEMALDIESYTKCLSSNKEAASAAGNSDGKL